MDYAISGSESFASLPLIQTFQKVIFNDFFFCLFGACSEPVVPTGRSLVGIRFSPRIQAWTIGGERKTFRPVSRKVSVRLLSKLELRVLGRALPSVLLTFIKKFDIFLKDFCHGWESNLGRLGERRASYPEHYGRWLIKTSVIGRLYISYYS